MNEAGSGDGFEDLRLRRLLSSDGVAGYELDLSGLGLAAALASVDQMVERQRFRERERSVRILVGAARDEDDTPLFHSVGRHLIGLMKRNLVAACRPLPGPKGGGFLILLPGRADGDPAMPNA